MSGTDCRTILRITGLLERVVTTSVFATLMGKVRAHCLLRSSAFKIAASRGLSRRTEELYCLPWEEMRTKGKRTHGGDGLEYGKHVVETARLGCASFELSCHRQCNARSFLLLSKRQDDGLFLEKFRADGWEWLRKVSPAIFRRCVESE